MAFPRSQIDIQTGIPHLTPVSVVGFTGQNIVEAPFLPSQLIPRHVDTRLGSFLPEVYDDEIALIVLDPAPSENILAALVVGPAAPLTETPFTIPKDITIGPFQQALIEGQRGPDRLALPGDGPETRAT